MRWLYDTSVFIASEQGRDLDAFPRGAAAISVVTIAELHLGVLMADDPDTLARRLQTIGLVERGYDALPADLPVMRRVATLASEQRRAGRKTSQFDTIIAATASLHGLGLVTQDRGFERFEGLDAVFV